MDMTHEQIRVAYPDKIGKSPEEINAVRRQLLTMAENVDLPTWKRNMAYEAAGVLTWVMCNKDLVWATFGGSVSHPFEELEMRNVSPCIGVLGFCIGSCEHDWKPYGDGLQEMCRKCMRIKKMEGVTDEQIMKHWQDMAKRAGYPEPVVSNGPRRPVYANSGRRHH